MTDMCDMLVYSEIPGHSDWAQLRARHNISLLLIMFLTRRGMSDIEHTKLIKHTKRVYGMSVIYLLTRLDDQ